MNTQEIEQKIYPGTDLSHNMTKQIALTLYLWTSILTSEVIKTMEVNS